MPHTPTTTEIVEAAPNYAATAARACAKAGLSLEALEAGVVADLLGACESVLEGATSCGLFAGASSDPHWYRERLKAAIAKAKAS